MQASYHPYHLDFIKPAGTSRGVMTQKETWFLVIEHEGKTGIGECGILRKLSIDDRPDYEEKLKWVCQNIDLGPQALWEKLTDFPSIQFGVETAFASLEAADPFVIFPSGFTEGRKSIVINGLVWMGTANEMEQQIGDKIAQDFTCIKLKIGAINFDQEVELLRMIRQKYTAEEIEIRVDANGAFSSEDALYKLKVLSGFQLHSIEQPVAAKQHDILSELCKNAPFPIALDEELIGIISAAEKRTLLEKIRPQYIILKPSLIGGFRGTLEWISVAKEFGIGWWITSALESNIALNAIAQFTFGLDVKIPQGLGTGGLYHNNFAGPLKVHRGHLEFIPQNNFDLSAVLRQITGDAGM
ncbi:MAG: o-succinylbenzoate synthase [Flavobacterium sp.]|nr:MAG: o-succinylbenzoate synthase [Flavobacterium sp.]